MARQFGWVSTGRLIGALIQAVTLALVARWAGPEGFGAVGVALAVVIVLQTITDLGLPTYIVRERAARPMSPTIRRALEMNNVTALWMSLTIFVAFAGFALVSQPVFFDLLPIAIWAAVDRNTDTWLGVTLADGHARLNATMAVTRRFLVLTTMVGLDATGVAPLVSFSAALAVVGVAVNQYAHRYVSKRVARPDVRPPARPILLASRPYWVTSVATQIRSLDTIVVGAIAGTSQAAFYAAASKITSPLRILPTSMAVVLVPAAARAGVRQLSTVRRPAIAMITGMSLIYAASAAAAPWVVPMTLGPEYQGAVIPIQIVLAGLIFAALGSILTAILQGIGSGKSVAWIAVFSTVVCLGGVLVGAIALGALGAAIAMSASFLVQAIVLSVTLRRARNCVVLAKPASAEDTIETRQEESNA
jgi:O-antigen/teichoic acid export membrane protein